MKKSLRERGLNHTAQLVFHRGHPMRTYRLNVIQKYEKYIVIMYILDDKIRISYLQSIFTILQNVMHASAQQSTVDSQKNIY